MSVKVSKADFFKSKFSDTKKPEASEIDDGAAQEAVGEKPVQRPLKLSRKAEDCLNKLTALLRQTKQGKLADKLDKLRQIYERRYFTVAVTGEFSRGKSTFINRLLETDALPVGNLPTTALLTKIRYNGSERLAVFTKDGKREKTLPLKESSWQGLTANLDGDDYEGIALVGLRCEWLRRTGVEIEDTPGAGDLSGKRAALTDEALMSDDGAIIAISATQPITSSEGLFIEQRLLAGKIPFLMVVITKLDLIAAGERAQVVEYIKNRVALWGKDIPVFIPYDANLGGEYEEITGMDKIKAEIEKWIASPDRLALNELGLMSRANDIADIALESLEEQRRLLQKDEEERVRLIEERKNKLSGERIVWNDLEIDMIKRCRECKELLARTVGEGAEKITERLQIEVSHYGDVKRWVENDYAYRLKSELMNLSVSTENSISRTISADAKWFNDALAQRYKIQLSFERQSVTDNEMIKNLEAEEIDIKDLTISKNVTRIGTTVLTIAGYALFMSTGIMPIIATMGIGTGASIISESVFRKKTEEQRRAVCAGIAKSVQSAADELVGQANEKVDEMYDSIVKNAVEREETWLEAQNKAAEDTVKAGDPDAAERLEKNIEQLAEIKKRLISAR